MTFSQYFCTTNFKWQIIIGYNPKLTIDITFVFLITISHLGFILKMRWTYITLFIYIHKDKIWQQNDYNFI